MPDYFTPEEIFEADDLKFCDVEIPEWGGKLIRISEMSGEQRARYELLGSRIRNGTEGEMYEKLRPLVICAAAQDPETGKPLFSELEHVERLNKKHAGVLDRLFKVADELNAITGKAQKEAEKNSPPVR